MQNTLTTTSLIWIINNNKKKLFLFVLLGTVIGAVTCLLLPKKYLSSTIVLPANPKTTDKNFIYGNSVLEPQSAFGLEEDADRLLTNLKLFSNFSTLVDSFDLITHYKITPNNKAKAYAIEELVSNTTINKTENGAIQINVWDIDKKLAAAIANKLIDIVEQKTIIQNQQINQTYLTQIKNAIAQKESELQSIDSFQNNAAKEIKRKVIQESYLKDLETMEQLQLSLANKGNAIIVAEKAYPSDKHDKPKLKYWILASLLSCFAFGLCIIVLLELNKKQ